ncbi:DUF2272 domain-containing protein [Methylobacterium terricola]|nr:DUF2272 domain-containing protein [Methylobacterium terricola]
MAFNDVLVSTVHQEWARWGFSTSALHVKKKIVGKEGVEPYVGYVNEYWRAVNQPARNGNSPYPWSAAFISFNFKRAGADGEFPYAAGHWDYCRDIVRSPKKFTKLSLHLPSQVAIEVGDVIWAARRGPQCPPPPKDAAAAFGDLKTGRWFCSHADIVVAKRSDEIDVIGGNVSDSVTQTTYLTSKGRIVDPRQVWLGVIKNTI